MSVSAIVTSDRKNKFFAVNLSLKLFPITVADADIGSPKSLHTFLKKMFVPQASDIWTKSYGQNYTKFWAFSQRWVLKKHFDKALTPF